MDISKSEKWSPSSNVYDDLRAADSLLCPKVPTRSTSIIGSGTPQAVDDPQMKRPTVSLILPTSKAFSEQITTMETILSIDDTKRVSAVELTEQKSKDLPTNKDYSYVSEEKDQSCICWTIRQTIQLICIALFGFFIAMFVFALIFYAFDVYWLRQSIGNHSSRWFDHNDTNFVQFDFDLIGPREMINDDDEY